MLLKSCTMRTRMSFSERPCSASESKRGDVSMTAARSHSEDWYGGREVLNECASTGSIRPWVAVAARSSSERAFHSAYGDGEGRQER